MASRFFQDLIELFYTCHKIYTVSDHSITKYEFKIIERRMYHFVDFNFNLCFLELNNKDVKIFIQKPNSSKEVSIYELSEILYLKNEILQLEIRHA